MKEALPRFALTVDDGNALGVNIEDGETVYEELTRSQYAEATPFWYHWKETAG